MDVVGDALETLGLPNGRTETRAVASLVSSYYEYVRLNAVTAGILEHQHAIHELTGAYIAYLEAKPAPSR